MKPSQFKRFIICIIAFAIVGFTSSSYAAGSTYTYSAGTGGNWSTSTWKISTTDYNGTTISGVANSLKFSSTSAVSLTLDMNLTAGQIINASSGAVTIAASGSNTITLDDTGGTSLLNGTSNSLISSQSSGALTINPNILIGSGNLDIANTGSGIITIAGDITATSNTVLSLKGNSDSPATGSSIIINGNIGNGGTGLIDVKVTGTRGSAKSATTINGILGTNVSSLLLGTGTTLTLTNTNTYTGSTTISRGSLVLNDSTASINQSSIININQSGTLTMSNFLSTYNYDRLKDSAAINMNGGKFNFTTDATTLTNSETTGAVTLGSGFSSEIYSKGIIAMTGGISSTLTFASITREAGATVIFSGNPGTVKNSVLFTSAPTLVNGIIPWAVVDGGGFATLDATYGIKKLGSFSSTAEASWSSTDNIGTNSAQTLTGDRTINSLSLSGNTIDLNGHTLTIYSGGIAITTATNATINATGGGAITAGTSGAGGELIINSNNNVTVNAAITDNGSGVVTLTKGGTNTLTLTGANTYTGKTYIGGGTLNLSGDTTLASTADIINNGTLLFSLTSGRTLTLSNNITSGAYVGGGNGNITQSVAGTRVILSGTNNIGGSIYVKGGALEITGATTLNNTYYSDIIRVGVTGASELTISGTGSLISNNNNANIGDTSGYVGVLNVKDSGQFILGSDANFVTSASNGAYGSAAGSMYVGNSTGSIGIVNQSGGLVDLLYSLFIGGGTSTTNAYGFYNMSGGTLNVKGYGNFRVGLTGSGTDDASATQGIFYLSGGTVNATPVTNQGLAVAMSGNSRGVYYQTGGTFNNTNSTSVGTGSASRGEFTIAGGTYSTTSMGVGGTSSSYSIINLNGGILNMGYLKYNNSSTGYNYFNANGGTLQLNSSTTSSFLANNIVGATGVNLINIYSGGLTIDTNGYSSNTGIALSDPTGNGVTSITLSNSGAGYTAVPYVKITDSGSGSGATAVAQLNPDGTITIIITSAGIGYTNPTVTLVGGVYTTAAIIGTVSISDNVSGGITKTGAGTLTFDKASTYTGDTTVNGGTLKAGIATTAFGISSNIQMANTLGATLDLANFSQTVGSLSGGGTTGGNITLGSGTLTTGKTGATTATYAGVISGTGGLTKTGNNTQILTGTNTYTGATTINEGTLLVNGSLASGSAVAVNAGLLAGTGTVSGAVTVNSGASLGGTLTTGAVVLNSGAVVTPGSDGTIGTLQVASATWNGGASYSADLGASTSDLLNVAGAFTQGTNGTYQFNFTDASGGLLVAGTQYDLVKFATTTFTDANVFTYAGITGLTGYFTLSGTDLYFTVTAIPEPSTWALLIGGVLMLAGAGIFKKRVSA